MTASGEDVVDLAHAPADDVLRLGGKGAGLARMAAEGLPVPPGFVITTDAGRRYVDLGGPPPGLGDLIAAHLDGLGERAGRRYGSDRDPLLVSVRSGAPVSMPGMMDTVLNVGLTEQSAVALAAETGDEHFAFSCFERLLSGFAVTVRGLDPDDIEDALEGSGGSRERCTSLLKLVRERSGMPFPDPAGQVREAVGAVFRSWDSRRARAYRRHKDIPDDLGTAVVVQAMVFGNRGDDSGSGVAFTRDPATGAPHSCGEFLAHAQGEDVVSGEHEAGDLDTLRERLPEVADELEQVMRALERRTGDMCDVEFTVDSGRLWVLQTRVGQRSGRAEVRIAVDLADEGVISRGEAVDRVERRGLDAVALPTFVDEPPADRVLARGLPASPGAATGMAVFDPVRAQLLADEGEQIVLIRPTTSPSDVQGLLAACAVVTGRGGPMSHAAVVARGLDRPAVCGIGEVAVAPDRRSAVVGGRPIAEGDPVAVDGDRGVVVSGELTPSPGTADPHLQRLLSWQDPTVGPDADARTTRTTDLWRSA